MFDGVAWKPVQLCFFVAVLAALGFVAPARAAECYGAHDAPSADSLNATACLVNAERTARGLPEIVASPLLSQPSAAHSEWMASSGNFRHEPGDGGSTPESRATAAGYTWSFIAENIAAGQGSPAEVVTAWLRSEGHCRNMLSPAPVDMGLGFALSSASLPQPVWTQMFGRLDGVAAPSADTGPRDSCPQQPRSPDMQFGGTVEVTVSQLDGTPRPLDDHFVTPTTSRGGFGRRITIRNAGDRPLARPAYKVTGIATVECDGCTVLGGPDGYSYVNRVLQPGESATLVVRNDQSPPDPAGTPGTERFSVTVDKQAVDSSVLAPLDAGAATVNVHSTWFWPRTAVGFDIPGAASSAARAMPIDDGVGVLDVPIVNAGQDAYPLDLSVFVASSRGASIVSAAVPDATCAPDKHVETGTPGIRCVFVGGLPAGARRMLHIVARPATTSANTDHGSIGLEMGPLDIVRSGFGGETAQSGYVLGDDLDDQSRARGFCVRNAECDLDLDGVVDGTGGGTPSGGATTPGTSTSGFKPAYAKVSLGTKAKLAALKLSKLRMTFTLTVPKAGAVSLTLKASGTRRGRRVGSTRRYKLGRLPRGRGSIRIRLPASLAGMRKATLKLTVKTAAGTATKTLKVKRITR